MEYIYISEVFMSRPKEHQNLRYTTISVDGNVLDKALVMGFNVSEICRQAIASAVNDPRQKALVEKFRGIPKIGLKRVRRILMRTTNPIEVAERLAKQMTERFGIPVTGKDLLDYSERKV